MTLEGFLRRVIAILDGCGIPYMLTGSIAVAYHAEPRATRDIDLVISVSPEETEELLRRLEAEGFYISRDAAREALHRQGSFNAIDPASGWKVDWIVRKDRPFSREEFARRRQVELLDMELFVVTAEDLIVAKLEWARKGASDLQRRDALALLLRGGAELDRGYIERWIDEFDLRHEWAGLLEEEGKA